jgi:hypothetical protein
MPASSHHESSRAVRSAIHMNVALLGILGAVVLVAPTPLLRGFGIADAPYAVYGLVRVLALLALVMAVLLWSARAWLATPDGRPARIALAAAYGTGAAFLFLQQRAVWNGRSGVALFLGFAALAASYGLAARPVARPVA